MLDEIEVRSSIDAGRVIWSEWMLLKILAILTHALFTLAPIFFACLFFARDVRESQVSMGSFVILSVGLMVTLFAAYCCRRLDKLTAYDATNVSRERIRILAQERGWRRTRDNKKYFVARLPMGLASWGGRIAIIYQEDKVLVNVVSFGLFELALPTHVFSCQQEANDFIADLNAIGTNTAA